MEELTAISCWEKLDKRDHHLACRPPRKKINRGGWESCGTRNPRLSLADWDPGQLTVRGTQQPDVSEAGRTLKLAKDSGDWLDCEQDRRPCTREAPAMTKWTEHHVSEEKPTRASKEREGQRRIEKGQMRPRMMWWPRTSSRLEERRPTTSRGCPEVDPMIDQPTMPDTQEDVIYQAAYQATRLRSRLVEDSREKRRGEDWVTSDHAVTSWSCRTSTNCRQARTRVINQVQSDENVTQLY
jgi:hypothetical protein